MKKTIGKIATKAQKRTPNKSIPIKNSLTGRKMNRKLLLRRDIKVSGSQQGVNQLDQFTSSKSECVSMLMLSNLTDFEVV